MDIFWDWNLSQSWKAVSVSSWARVQATDKSSASFSSNNHHNPTKFDPHWAGNLFVKNSVRINLEDSIELGYLIIRVV